MAEMLEEIRPKSKPAWRSNMVDMNYDEYYEDAWADLYDNKYLRIVKKKKEEDQGKKISESSYIEDRVER
uniref:Uncharacterized protein n=1 Tax=Romanomermis culicivorax TaxID=13658 RepID=A0A915JA36_ROMCU